MGNMSWLANGKSGQCHHEEICHCKPSVFKPEKKEECCCNCSMRDALKLLFDKSVINYMDFYNFAYFSNKFISGTFIVADSLFANGDNLYYPTFDNLLTVSECQCDYITKYPYYSPIFYPIPSTMNEEGYYEPYYEEIYSDKVSLCDLDAVVFNFNPENGPALKSALIELLDDNKHLCNKKPEPCCCNEGIYNNIYHKYTAYGNYVSLNAGWLVVDYAEVLGRVGNVVFLINSQYYGDTIYMVCLNSIKFMENDPYLTSGKNSKELRKDLVQENTNKKFTKNTRR